MIMAEWDSCKQLAVMSIVFSVMRKSCLVGCLVLCSSLLPLHAEDKQDGYVINSFWSNWYVQAGLDMSLQNPYGHDFFGGVFPNGKTFGVDVAVGKWFTPSIGLRGRVNWENGIGLFKNDHDNWLAPFYQPGVNRSKGGYITVTGDIQFDLHNMIWGYRSDRMWNMQVFPRAGAAYNFGVSKGTPLLGIGIGNTFKINDRIGIYFDVAYNMVSSGFVGVEKNTGIGSNSNGFFDIGAGVTVNLGKTKVFRKVDSKSSDDREVKTTGKFWSNWFVQLGLDMSLQNPYGKDFFGDVFPNGKTFGFDVAAGKWFSPHIALRGKVNWENGFPLFENKHLTWVGSAENPSKNMDDGGILVMTLDVPISVKNIIMDYKPDQKWNCYVYPSAGLGCNLSIGSSSPTVGVGFGGTYHIRGRTSVYADMSYHFITSEFMGGVAGTGMEVAAGSNGFLSCGMGVQIDL